MSRYRISDGEYAKALAAGEREAETEFRAEAVRYVADRDAIEIVTRRNTGFLTPRQWIGALQELTARDLRKLEVWPDGSAIGIEDKDVHIGVHGLIVALLPAMLPARVIAAVFASRGGQSASTAKRRTAQENGRKGGRPRKRKAAA